jgi:hypothetical protein
VQHQPAAGKAKLIFLVVEKVCVVTDGNKDWQYDFDDMSSGRYACKKSIGSGWCFSRPNLFNPYHTILYSDQVFYSVVAVCAKS